MITIPGMAEVPIAVLGLARSGLTAAQSLIESGAQVMAWDDAPERRQAAAAAGVPIVDLETADWGRVRTLVLSPGIPHSFPKPHPIAAKALAAKAALVSDIDLLGRARPDGRYLGVTGTNGKSTTTTLIGHLFRQHDLRSEVGGNVGVPVLSLAALDVDGWYVLEMSSYQLELTHSIDFDIAVLLNVTPDHLDRHGGFEGYVAAKRRIFRGQGGEATAIVALDDETSRKIYDDLIQHGRQSVVPVSASGPAPGGVYVEDNWLIDDMDGWSRPMLDLAKLPNLPGQHNQQNAVAAYAAAKAAGLVAPRIAASLSLYPGLAHRQERIAVIGGVAFINDSKATNADAAARALACYEAIYWIAGGKPKEGGIASLEGYFPRIVHAFLIGEAARAFADTLEGRVPYTLSGDLESAVGEASSMAGSEHRPGAVVLLSPACASFDQFADFEARGEEFRRLVKQLAAESMQ
ncbi:MAG: UDP-N-acetylmuramoyl-L-alanine--D-glutamate ligase [Proteobacteria bacterium]|nr:UDP-N-acetylmuramoyl-L-alanine--D-glutamate ligase [Pseudomonadota bacterium]MBI3496582.1 UDP-N-acetylmuramoyl-L-alanine--D-glutamate ligase [Pseudomonadota bacterium]